jgi:hypothetical protein
MTESCLESEICSLRTEIIESEKARIDLLKYKLISIAALGAIGIGVGGYEVKTQILDPELVLAIIPLACVYIDLLCWHNTLRILVIACFLKGHDDPYEKFIEKIGDNLYELGEKEAHKHRNPYHKKAGYFFQLEDWALHWSTIFLSMLLFLWGILHFIIPDIHGVVPENGLPINSVNVHGATFIGMGLIGITLPILFHREFVKRLEKLFEASSKPQHEALRPPSRRQ